MIRKIAAGAGALGSIFAAGAAWAAETAETVTEAVTETVTEAAVETAPAAAAAFVPTAEMVNKGDVAWMLVASALVLMMSVPALALFYGGLVRAKTCSRC